VPAAQALLRHHDAGALATAALLTTAGAPEYAAQASTLAPESAPIAWVRLRVCASAPACDVRDAATAMRWIDPDNAAAWLTTLAAAARDRDTTEVDRILGDMAQGKRFDFYVIPAGVMMFDSLSTVASELPGGALASDSARLAAVNSIAEGSLVPPFAALNEACRDLGSDAERRESCLRIARILQQSDTVSAQLDGLTMFKRLVPADGREARALGERRRELDWRLKGAAKYDSPLLPWVRNAHARWRLAQMRKLHREEDLFIAILREQGLPIFPPDGR
jgi:hypothetical protein